MDDQTTPTTEPAETEWVTVPAKVLGELGYLHVGIYGNTKVYGVTIDEANATRWPAGSTQLARAIERATEKGITILA